MNVKWQFPGWQWVDPLKEVKAAKEAIKAGIKSSADVISEIGNDWEGTYEQISIEQKKAADLGLTFDVEEVPENAGIETEINNSD